MTDKSPAQAPDSTRSDELEQLKDLLFGAEAASLNDLRHRIMDRQQRTEDVALILPESLKTAGSDKKRLVGALKEPVDECIRSLVKNNPEEFADSLFPVMGPAIRKSIRETLKSFLQSINEMLEQSMSAEALKWRWEAKRTGVPFSEIVLKHSLVYRVDEVLLIQQQTGLMIAHISHPQAKVRDSDAVSAMLTVIRDFSRDSFSTNPQATLDTVEIGDQTVWMFDGPKAQLACVISGIAPISSRNHFQSVLETLHMEYDDELENFDGNRTDLEPIQQLLENCLTQEVKTSKKDHDADNWRWLLKPANIVLLLIAMAAIYWLAQQYFDHQRINSLRADLERTPGVVVFDIEKENNHVIVNGLVDPMVDNLSNIAQLHGISESEITFDMSLYQSLDAPIALQRAHQLLRPPESLMLTAAGETLTATGAAPEQWIKRTNDLKSSIPGFSSVDLSAVEIDEQIDLERIRHRLQAPQTVKLEVVNRVLHISGSAPFHWIKRVRNTRFELKGIVSLNFGQRGNLVAEELTAAEELIKELNITRMQFGDDTELTFEGQSTLDRVSIRLKTLLTLADQLETSLYIGLTGYTDGTGEEEFNDELKLKRAEIIKQHLTAMGVSTNSITIKRSDVNDRTQIPDMALRRVELEVHMEAPTYAKNQ